MTKSKISRKKIIDDLQVKLSADDQSEIVKLINSLTGTIKVDNPNNFDCDKAKYEYFKEKYNL